MSAQQIINGRANLPELPEINIPYAVASTRYGGAIAAMMDRKASSRALEAIDKSADKFRWALAYSIGPDPEDTLDENEFLEALKENTSVYLVGRGFKWKAWESLGIIPPQIMARLEERARLICGQRNSPALRLAEEQEETGLLATFEAWLQQHHQANGDLAEAAKWILKRLEQVAEA